MESGRRKLVGVTAMTVFFVVYIAVAMVIGAAMFIDVPFVVQLVYFVVAGLAWTIPVALIIKWMRGTPKQAEN